jgi:hypothetical protein
LTIKNHSGCSLGELLGEQVVAVQDANAQAVLHELPHHELVLGHDREVLLGQVQAERVETFEQHSGAEAHAYVDTGRKKGNVVLSVPE